MKTNQKTRATRVAFREGYKHGCKVAVSVIDAWMFQVYGFSGPPRDPKGKVRILIKQIKQDILDPKSGWDPD